MAPPVQNASASGLCFVEQILFLEETERKRPLFNHRDETILSHTLLIIPWKCTECLKLPSRALGYKFDDNAQSDIYILWKSYVTGID